MLYYAFCNQVLVQLVMMFKSACSNSILSGTNSPYASREEVICHYLYVQHCIERASRHWQCFLTTISVSLLFGSLFNAFLLITGSQDFITGFLALSFAVGLLFFISVPVGVSSMCSGVRGSIERTGFVLWMNDSREDWLSYMDSNLIAYKWFGFTVNRGAVLAIASGFGTTALIITFEMMQPASNT